LFVAPREKRLLFSIEKNTGKRIEPMKLPSGEEVSGRRIEQFKQTITETIESQNLDFFFEVLSDYSETEDRSAEEIACALAYLLQKEKPLQVVDKPNRKQRESFDREDDKGDKRYSGPMDRYRLEVGRDQQVGPGDIVGAIVNESDITKNAVGHIKLHDSYSTVDLPQGMPDEVFQGLKKVKVRGIPMNLSCTGPAPKGEDRSYKKKGKPGRKKNYADKKPHKRPRRDG